MDQVTTALGQELRQFCAVTCSAFKTTELPKEAAARSRQRSRQEARTAKDPSATRAPEETAKQLPKEKKPKTLNLFIYKVHALGDYVNTIRRLGTTDSFSTQIVSLSHMCFGI